MPLNEPTISIYFFPSRFTITDLSDSQKIESKCFSLVYSLYHLLNLSFSQSDRLNYPFLSSKKTRNEKFQNRKDIPVLPPLSHLFNFPLPPHPPPPPPPPPPPLNSPPPLPPPPPPRAWPRVKLYCLCCSFLLLVVVRHFSHFLCLSLFLSVWNYRNALCNSIAI